jgi:hypothetical protein
MVVPVPADYLTNPGSVVVTVATYTGSPTAVFTVTAQPVITAIGPNSATAGGPAFLLLVHGTSLYAPASVRWGSSTLSSFSIDDTELAAVVPADLIANPGTAKVTVITSGGTSAPATFTIK